MGVVGRIDELAQARTSLSSLADGPVALVYEGEAGSVARAYRHAPDSAFELEGAFRVAA
jgi:hypothetical protein